MVHDIVCSWCPIGYSNIKGAIDNLKLKDKHLKVDFNFLPFELNPEMGAWGEAIGDFFNRRMGWNESKLLDYQKSLVKTAAESGVTIDFSKRKRYYNTRKAHLLMHLAEGQGKQEMVNELLIEAYFKDGLDISDSEELLNIASEANLAITLEDLTSTEASLELDKKVKLYRSFNITSIPTFIVNGDILISGSNSVASFEVSLSKIISRSKADPLSSEQAIAS